MEMLVLTLKMISTMNHTSIFLLPYFCYKTSSRSLVGLVATKSHACYLLGGNGWDWVGIPLGLNFSGSAGGVSGHMVILCYVSVSVLTGFII